MNPRRVVAEPPLVGESVGDGEGVADLAADPSRPGPSVFL